jgi:ubiquinone/menaquinone biosynthesis C-methylase UbiE
MLSGQEVGMDQVEMVTLIRDGVPQPGGTWADLGAGTGNFTWALYELLGPQATIYAVDRDARAIAYQRTRIAQAAPRAAIYPMQADFTRPLTLPPLDGVLMANALHFVRDQVSVLALVTRYLRPGGRLLLVEYELRDALRWVPFPVPFARFVALAEVSGLVGAALLRTRRSPSSGRVLYAAVGLRPA